jgi:O-Antigen ligase
MTTLLGPTGSASVGAQVPAPRFDHWLTRLQVEAATWILLGSFVGYPIVAITVSLLGVDSQVLTIPYRIGILLLVFMIFGSAVKRRLRGRIDRVLLAFLVLYLARLLYDLTTTNILGVADSTLFYTMVVFFPALAVASAGTGDRSDGEIARRLVLAGGLMLSLATVGILLGKVSQNWYYEEGGGGRLGFDALNPIALGHAAASTVMACIFSLLVATTTRKWKLVCAVVMVLGAFILFKASSKGPFIALMVALFWYGAAEVKRFAKLVPLMLLLPFLPGVEAMVIKTIENLGGGWSTDDSSLGRLEAQRLALEDFFNYPILGRHFFNDSLGAGYYAHNLFFESAQSMGLVGLTLFAMICVRGARNTLGFYNAQHPLLVMLLIQYFIHTNLSGAIWGSDAFFLLLALCVSPNIYQLPQVRRGYPKFVRT